MNAGISRDEWLQALTEANVVPPSDDAAVTVRDFQELFSLPRYTAERRLEALVRAGKATRTQKRGPALDGRIRYMRAYRLEPASKRLQSRTGVDTLTQQAKRR